MARNKSRGKSCDVIAEDVLRPGNGHTADSHWKRQRKERINHSPSKLNVDVHGILFAVVAIVFVIYPLAQWALGL